LVAIGKTAAEAWKILDEDETYSGVKNRIKRLESHSRDYCAQGSIPFTAFLGGSLYGRWDIRVSSKRNRAVHAGIAAFSYQEASDAIGIAKETIAFLDSRIPSLSDRIRLDPAMSGYRDSGSAISF
jgi:hypothetical protein